MAAPKNKAQRKVRLARSAGYPKIRGWFEDYRCGCVSETVRTKRELLGYCGQHGDDRRKVWPDIDFASSELRHGANNEGAAGEISTDSDASEMVRPRLLQLAKRAANMLGTIHIEDHRDGC